MAALRTEKAYEKYAWVLLLPGGFLYLLLGIAFTSSPAVLGPTVPMEVRFFGVALIGLTVFGLAITLNSYRKGEKWAWYTLWYYPILFGSIFTIEYGDPYFAANSSLFLALSLIGLFLPYRKFFPKKGAKLVRPIA